MHAEDKTFLDIFVNIFKDLKFYFSNDYNLAANLQNTFTLPENEYFFYFIVRIF